MTCRNSIALLCAAAFFSNAARAAEWEVIRQDGRDYVRLDNVAEFYRFAEYSQTHRTISLRAEHRTIHAQVGTSELLINGVRFFTNFPLLEKGEAQLISALDVGKIIEPVLRPSRIAKPEQVETVVLDPGHGGTDQGAANQWGSEKDYALDVALAAREELLRAGYKVEMTRSDDSATSLEQRVQVANCHAKAVFISIHFNSAAGGAGVESYSLAPAGVPSNVSAEGEAHPSVNDSAPDDGNAQDSQNIALAAAVHAAVLSRAGASDRGVRHARFKVLRNIHMPAVLLEAGFLNNPADGARIASRPYRQQLGAAIAHGVQSYNTAVNYRAGNMAVFTAPPDRPPAGEVSAADTPSVSIDGGNP